MKSSLAAGAAALMAMASAASAASVSEKVEIAAAPAKVWAALGDFCGISAWHPAIAKCTLAEADGKKVRTLTTGDGATFVESLEGWDDAGMSYSYRIQSSPLPLENYLSTIKVSGEGDKSTIEWSSTFDPKGASEDDAKKIVSTIYQAGFEGLKKKF
jgi:uncharacterized protein YndB with AHSA1/START domain